MQKHIPNLILVQKEIQQGLLTTYQGSDDY